MKELERQRVCRIALDHAIRMQREEPPPKHRHVLKITAAALAGVAATAALAAATAATFLH